jgi:radical SAM protein (TIGR01212 family)
VAKLPEAARYRRFSEYLKARFGGPVRKLGLDAGFSCPNRDGLLSRDGCVFCDPRGFTPRTLNAQASLEAQLTQQIQKGTEQGFTRFMAYFQPYTNTYAPVENLQAAYDRIRAFPEIKALAVGTRPDCVDVPRLELLAGYARDYEVWLELGLQSIHAETLRRLNRGHDAEAFFQAVALARHYPMINLCAHVMLGLPGETPEHELATARALGKLRMEGVKFHPLYVVKGTPLEKEHAEKHLGIISRAEYAGRVGAFLEHLWPQTIIQRLTADCPPDLLIAPDWLGDKSAVIREIEAWLHGQQTRQGFKFSA